jgi:MYXO-CTERM domain-containing protein
MGLVHFGSKVRIEKRKVTIMNVKRFMTIAGGAALLTTTVASAEFYGLSAELVGNNLVEGTWTARIYADLSAGSRVDAIYGNGANPLMMSSTGGLYQNIYGGDTSAEINAALYGAFPSLMYDSWVTIGLEDSGDNALGSIGMNFSENEISTADGSWFVTPDDSQGQEIGGKVLIAQFTTYGNDSILYGTISLQGKDASGANWSAESVDYDFAKPAPGAIALLGLAGFAGRRRRRA